MDSVASVAITKMIVFMKYTSFWKCLFSAQLKLYNTYLGFDEYFLPDYARILWAMTLAGNEISRSG
jgi:hypothetical protein